MLTQQSFQARTIEKGAGEMFTYHEYAEGNKKITVRFYGNSLAVDYYVGIDMEDSLFTDPVHEITDEDLWTKALEFANTFFTRYEFTGKQEE